MSVCLSVCLSARLSQAVFLSVPLYISQCVLLSLSVCLPMYTVKSLSVNLTLRECKWTRMGPFVHLSWLSNKFLLQTLKAKRKLSLAFRVFTCSNVQSQRHNGILSVTINGQLKPVIVTSLYTRVFLFQDSRFKVQGCTLLLGLLYRYIRVKLILVRLPYRQCTNIGNNNSRQLDIKNENAKRAKEIRKEQQISQMYMCIKEKNNLVYCVQH